MYPRRHGTGVLVYAALAAGAAPRAARSRSAGALIARGSGDPFASRATTAPSIAAGLSGALSTRAQRSASGTSAHLPRRAFCAG